MPGTQTRARGPYRTGVRRREQLIAVAIDVFGEHGFAGGSLRAIADKAGVSHATLIQHFGSKEGLLTAVLEEWDRRTVENGLADVSGLDYFRRLPEVMAAHQDNRGLLELFTTIAAEASSPAHPAHAFITQRYTTNLATLAGHLREAVEAGDVEPLTACPDRDRSAPGHRSAGRHRAAMAPRPLHRRPRQRHDLRRPRHRRLARPAISFPGPSRRAGEGAAKSKSDRQLMVSAACGWWAG